MGYQFLYPDQADDAVFTDVNVFIAGPDEEHLNACCQTLPEPVRNGNRIFLGPALYDQPRKIKPLGNPAAHPAYNFGLMGLYAPPEFASQFPEYEVRLGQAIEMSGLPMDIYMVAARHVIQGLQE